MTGFSAIAMQENESDVVEIRIPECSGSLEVLLNHKTLNFSEQTWMDLKGKTKRNPSRALGVNAKARGK